MKNELAGEANWLASLHLQETCVRLSHVFTYIRSVRVMQSAALVKTSLYACGWLRWPSC